MAPDFCHFATYRSVKDCWDEVMPNPFHFHCCVLCCIEWAGQSNYGAFRIYTNNLQRKINLSIKFLKLELVDNELKINIDCVLSKVWIGADKPLVLCIRDISPSSSWQYQWWCLLCQLQPQSYQLCLQLRKVKKKQSHHALSLKLRKETLVENLSPDLLIRTTVVMVLTTITKKDT